MSVVMNDEHVVEDSVALIECFVQNESNETNSISTTPMNHHLNWADKMNENMEHPNVEIQTQNGNNRNDWWLIWLETCKPILFVCIYQ